MKIRHERHKKFKVVTRKDIQNVGNDARVYFDAHDYSWSCKRSIDIIHIHIHIIKVRDSSITITCSFSAWRPGDAHGSVRIYRYPKYIHFHFEHYAQRGWNGVRGERLGYYPEPMIYWLLPSLHTRARSDGGWLRASIALSLEAVKYIGPVAVIRSYQCCSPVSCG